MSADLISTRVNSARLPDYIGKVVRFTCKALKFNGDTATVQGSDGGQVIVKLPRDAQVLDTYIEIIGTVQDATTIKMVACTNLGTDLDMKLVNDTIELIHDPRFYSKMFQP